MTEMNLDSGSLFEKIKASVAYHLCLESGSSEAFAWSCGSFKGLCEIKAEALRNQTIGEQARILTGKVGFPLIVNDLMSDVRISKAEQKVF